MVLVTLFVLRFALFFHRSVQITINELQVYNLPVLATIHEPFLELPSKSITLSEQCSASIDTGNYTWYNMDHIE